LLVYLKEYMSAVTGLVGQIQEVKCQSCTCLLVCYSTETETRWPTYPHTHIHTFLSWATLFRTDKDLLKSNKNSKITAEIINYSPGKMCIIKCA